MEPTERSSFEKILDGFKKRLSSEHTEMFRLATFDDLKASITRLQTEQAARNGLQNLNKIKPFLNSLKEYAGVLEVFVQAKPDVLAFIWGPIKLCLQIASKLNEAFDGLLDAYEKIGNSLPVLSTIDALFCHRPHVKQVLANIFEDVLDFHKRAIVFFKHGTWKLTFKLTYHTFGDMFGDILKNLDRSREVLLQAANIAHYQESQDARILFATDMKVLLDRQREQRRVAIMYWLSSEDDYVAQHQELKEIRNQLPQTTRWIFSQQRLLGWLNRTVHAPYIFWLCGIPGAGKTVIFSSVIDEIQRNQPESQVVYFYCKHNNPNRSHFADIAKSLISQLLNLNPNCEDFIYESMLASNDSRAKDPLKLFHVLEGILKNHDSLYVGIDGLDECSEEERKLSSKLININSEVNEDPGNVRFLVTSRQEKDLEVAFNSADKFDIKAEYLENDITAYITLKMAKLSQKYDWTQEREQLVMKDICTRPKGMFLLARLIMDNLLSQDSLEDLEEELKSEVLPYGIDQACVGPNFGFEILTLNTNLVCRYDRMLVRIGKTSSLNPNQQKNRRNKAKLVLSLVTSAKRGLYAHEIQGALAINLEKHSVDFKNRHLRDPLEELCGPIIQVKEKGSVDLIHSTAREYLWQHHSNHFIQASDAEDHMANLCSSYLTFDFFSPDLPEDEFSARALSGDLAFQEYATCNWLKHLQPLCADIDDKGLIPEDLRKSIMIVTGRYKTHPGVTSGSESGRLCKADLDRILNEIQTLFTHTISISAEVPESQEGIPHLLAQIQHARTVIEASIVQGIDRKVVDKLHGRLPFRCPFIQCSYFVTGFRHLKERDKHEQSHLRPFVCSHDNCEFSLFGLPSNTALQVHLSLYHENQSQSSAFPDMKARTLERALVDAIVANNLLSIKDLATELASVEDRQQGFVLQALMLGYREAAALLVDLLGTPSELDHIKQKSAAILEVCKMGDVGLFDAMVANGVNINTHPAESDALSIAAQNGHLIIVKKLFENEKYEEEFSHATLKRKGAITMASMNDHAEVVSYLLEKDDHFQNRLSRDVKGALNAATRLNRTSCAKKLLSWAMKNKQSLLPHKIRPLSDVDQMVKVLEADRARIITENGGTRENALQALARKGDCEAVLNLLDLGADINNIKGIYGTPLMAAATNGQLEMVNLLIERGANVMIMVNGSYRSGGSAIDSAAAHGHEMIVRALLNQGAVFSHDSLHLIKHQRRTALHTLIRADGSAAIVRLLLENNADLESQGRDDSGSYVTPLQLGVMSGDLSTVEVLLEYGANVNTQNISKTSKHNATPLCLAISRSEQSILFMSKLLSVENIEIDAKNGGLEGLTALHMAAKLSKLDALDILLDHGANINAMNNKGETALIMVAKSQDADHWEKYQQIIHTLVDRGSDIEAIDTDRNTAIIAAADGSNSRLEMIKFLVESGAEVSASNWENSTALMMAAKYKETAIVRYLLQCRVMQQIVDYQEIRGAIGAAIFTGNTDITRILLDVLRESDVPDDDLFLSKSLEYELSMHLPNSEIVSLLKEYGATSVPHGQDLHTLPGFRNQQLEDD